MRTPVPQPPSLPVSDPDYRRAAKLYETFCLTCHGVGAIGGGVLADLRKSPMLHDTESWQRVVMGGERAPPGMRRVDNT